MSDAIIICGFPSACQCLTDDHFMHECQLCGGWMHSEVDGVAEVPEGEPGICGRYCSTDCHDEAVEVGWHTCEVAT